MNTGIRVDTIELPTGVRLEYAASGPAEGPAILMLHGITDSWRSFEGVIAQLPANVRACALSQRGHGRSSRPAKGYATRDFAADAAAFIESMGAAPMLVVGHSMGSANALRLAFDRPDLVAGLSLAGAFASFSDKADLVEYFRDAIVALRDPVPETLARDFQASTIHGAVKHGLIDMAVAESLLVPAHIWRQAFASLFEDDFLAAGKRLAMPLQVHWGDSDSYCPRSDQGVVMSRADDAELHTYRGVGHALHWEQPERFANLLAAFARRVFRSTT